MGSYARTARKLCGATTFFSYNVFCTCAPSHVAFALAQSAVCSTQELLSHKFI